MPSGVGYGLNVDQMELMSLQGQLFVVEGPDYDLQTKSWKTSVDFFGNLVCNPRFQFKEGQQVLGKCVMFESFDYSQRGVKPKRLQESQVIVRAVRNLTGMAVFGKLLYTLKAGDPNAVDGLAVSTAQECYPADEFLPAAGCPTNDIFYIVVRGPAILRTPMAGAVFGNTSINQNDVLVSCTTSGGSSSAGTTANGGRVQSFSIVAATTIAQITDVINVSQKFIGVALSAITSGQTNSDILVDVGRPRAEHW
jgi:hypothetical protein